MIGQGRDGRLRYLVMAAEEVLVEFRLRCPGWEVEALLVHPRDWQRVAVSGGWVMASEVRLHGRLVLQTDMVREGEVKLVVGRG